MQALIYWTVLGVISAAIVWMLDGGWPPAEYTGAVMGHLILAYLFGSVPRIIAYLIRKPMAVMGRRIATFIAWCVLAFSYIFVTTFARNESSVRVIFQPTECDYSVTFPSRPEYYRSDKSLNDGTLLHGAQYSEGVSKGPSGPGQMGMTSVFFAGGPLPYGRGSEKAQSLRFD
jgi:hypothetical protein